MANNSDFSKTRYTHRDYESLKKDLISAIPSLTQKWTSTEESDPGIVLIKLMAMMGDNLSYNMDKMALEMYIDSVTQRKNCRKILALLGYKMHWYRSATVMATVRNMLMAGTTLSGSPIILTPWETTFRSGNIQYVFIPEDYENTNVITLLPLADSKSIPLVEGTINTARFTGSSLQNNRYYFSKRNIDEKHIRLLVVDGSNASSEQTYLVDNLYLVGDNNTIYFEFGVDEYDMPYIELVDFWRSLVNENATFIVQYLVSSGADGNISDNAFDLIQYSNGSCLYVSNLSNNTENALEPHNTPGKNPQTPNDARKESADWVFTYDTLVSSSDFEKATRRFAGIYNSKLVDGEVIKLDDLDMHEVLWRQNDYDEFGQYVIVDTDIDDNPIYRMTPYIVIMYLIHQDFTDNVNCLSESEYDQNAWFEDVSNAEREYEFDGGAYDVSNYTGQQYFPYKINDVDINQVELGVNENKIMNVEMHYGTTKVFPFKVDGVLHFIEPLDPVTIEYIIDVSIENALKLHFRPDNKHYGEKPSFLEIVDVVQNADPRIKYFDAESSLIDWVLTYDNGSPKFDTTSFAKYQGLSSTFNVDDKFMKFTVTNVNIEEEAIELKAPTDESSAPYPLSWYQDINVTIDYSDTVTVVCENIPQLRTLAWWINTGLIAYNN